jgi:hypothetical protein
MKKLIYLLTLSCCLLVVGCARMGNPDGGWYDDTPPRVIGSEPADKATNVKARRIVINFDEFIKVADVQSKVIVSPPQLETPEIKAAGKRIIVELKDTLKDNTTYTIDFSDAISDNNEGNPMGNYTFTFSTGSQIDTLEAAGYVLNAENLEPIKGILVGLYQDLSDTIFRHEPMIRISRTDSRGHFAVKGVAPGTYRAYALQDADDNYVYSQKSEMIAFSHDTFEPSWMPDTRQDTIWRDSLHIANIVRVPYTHFLPDDITLMAFTAVQDSRYLIKTERKEPEKLGFFFTYGDTQPPVLRGLNFDSDSAFVVESSPKNDTIYYWLRDTMLVNQDTLNIEAQYMMTDTAGVLVSKTDTLEFIAKTPYEKRVKAKEKEYEKWFKEQEKKKKKGSSYDSIMPRKFLQLRISPSGSIDPYSRIVIESPTPLQQIDTAGIHLATKVDSLFVPLRYTFRQHPDNIRQYVLTAPWQLGAEYSLDIDSAAVTDIYGLETNAVKQSLKVKTEEDYSTLEINLSGVRDTGIVVQLLNGSDAVVRQQRVSGNSTKFLYVNPGKYYIRAFVDANGNNLWDTGDYDADRQPEAVYYYHQETECKAKWDVKRDWDLAAQPRYQQKPLAITKQKPDQQKKLKNRNLERAKQLGIEYIQDKTGMKL